MPGPGTGPGAAEGHGPGSVRTPTFAGRFRRDERRRTLAGAPALGPGLWPAAAVLPEAGLTLAGDVRLDNGAQLAARLGLGSAPAPTDADVVLAAYARWGDGALSRLYGDFAFGLWDGRRRRLVCGRDALGVRPLYYHASAAAFAFAGDAATLLADPGIPRRLNRGAITDFLTASFDDTERTGFLDVLRLPPGHMVVVDGEGHRLRRYWEPDTGFELRLAGDGEYEEAFRDALAASVAARSSGAGRLGVSLSGGLDSTAITCLAARTADRPLFAYNAVFPAGSVSDERYWVDAAIEQSAAARRPCDPQRTSPLADWGGAPWRGPAPECTPQISVCRVTLEAAGRDGVGVVLHGFAGDSVVSYGLGHLAELFGSGHVLRAARETEAVARRHGKRRRSVWMTSTVGPNLPPAALRAWRAARPGRPAAPGGIVHPALLAARRSAQPPGPVAPPSARRAHAADVTAGIVAAVMEASHRVDGVAGVERRYPFLDRGLVELCVSLPGDQKLRDGWTRSIMRRALDGILPPAVQQRTTKGNLSPAFGRALVARDLALVDSVVAHPGRLAEWVDPRALIALRGRCGSGGTSADWFELWRAVVAAQWLRHHGFETAAGAG